MSRRARSCAAATGPPPPVIMSLGHPNNKAAARNMTGNVIETVMGGVVLVVAALFLFFAYTTSQVRAVQGYQVSAQFERVDGIRDGSDVRIAGVKVGSIVSETLDPKTYLATVRMSIDPAYKLPDDTIGEMIFSSPTGQKKPGEGEAPQGAAPK